MRQDRKNRLGPLGFACLLITVSTFVTGCYDSGGRRFVRHRYLVNPVETHYLPGFIFDMTDKERRFGYRPTSSEQFVRSQWPVVQRGYDDVTSWKIDTYQIYTYDDQQITSDNRPRQRYRYRTRTLRRGMTVR